MARIHPNAPHVQPRKALPTPLQVALNYAAEGIPTFPASKSKKPVWSNEALGVTKGQGGFKMATTDPDRLKFLFKHAGATGVGMPTGKVSGLIVMDIDSYKEGPAGQNARKRAFEFEDDISATHRVRTQSGGTHAYFKWQPGHSKDDLGPGIEVQTDGAYVMVPPFFGYTVENEVFFDELVPPPWPGKVPRAAERRTSPIGDIDPEVRAHIDDLYRSEQAGGWHNAMVRIVAYLVGIGWTDAHILRFGFQWTNAGYTPQETFEDVAIAVEGARAKWQRETEPKTTDEARLRTIAENWARSTPEGRKVIYEAIKAAAKGDTE